MSQTQETIVWVDAPILGNRSKMSQDGRFTIEQKAGYYYLRDTTSGTTEPCNKKRLPLKGCKALAEEIVAGEKEDAWEAQKPVTNQELSNMEEESEKLESVYECSGCGSRGFQPSILQNQCTFCDGTEGGCGPEKIKELTEGHYFPGDPFPPGPDNLPKNPEVKRVFPPPKEKTLVAMDYKELELPGFNLSKVLAPSVVPFRVLTMSSAESRTKTKSRGMKIEDESLRGGTTDKVVNPVPVVHHKLKTREEVQQILNRLMVEKGVNLPNWADWIPILRENGVDPIEVRQGMLATAEKWAREHAEEEAAKKRQPRQVALEHLPPGTTFRIPDMKDRFEIGVLLSLNQSAAKVRITQGCKDRELDWSLGTLVVVVGKVELEKPQPSHDNETGKPSAEDVLPPWETLEDVMKVKLESAKKLLVALGLAATAVNKMSVKKIATKINSIEKFVEEAEKVEGDNLKLLEKIIAWREKNEDGTIEIVTGDEEQEETEEVQEGQPKKKRGRPKVEKEEKEEPEEEKLNPALIINGEQPRFYESVEPRLEALTHELAKKFRDMARFPRDRELQKARMEYLRGAVKQKEFRGAEWVSAKCEENGEIYRVNGKHTSTVCCEFFDNKQQIEDVQILVREFTCPTMADAAALFSTFDTKQSSRTKQDFLRAYASSVEETAELPDWLITLITAGLSFAKWEGRNYRSKSVDQQASVLLGQRGFASWLGKLLEDRKTTKNLARVPVVGVMAKTRALDEEKSDEFWQIIRDDTDGSKNQPTRKLIKWLSDHNLGGRGQTGTGASEKEFYVICVKAWNAWRKGEETVTLSYNPDKEVPQLV